MKIEYPEVKKILDDYDITYVSGLMIPITVDKSLGDEVEFPDGAIIFKLTSKPSKADPEVFLPAEEITVFVKHLACVQHRVREVTLLSPDQQVEWKKTLQEISKTKH